MLFGHVNEIKGKTKNISTHDAAEGDGNRLDTVRARRHNERGASAHNISG